MTVKINNNRWEVLWVKPHSKKLICDDVKCLGVTYFDRRRIYLKRTQSAKEFRKTVIHELTHAFLHSYGIDLESSTESVDEVVCEFTENYFNKILKLSNKIYAAWELDMAARTVSAK